MASRKPQSKGRWDALSTFKLSGGKTVSYYSLAALERAGLPSMARLPFSIRIVLESLLRNLDGRTVTEGDVETLAGWNPKDPADCDVPFKVARVLMQDFTGVPAVVDLTAMRDYIVGAGRSPDLIQPIIPVDLVIDHSVQVDSFNYINAVQLNQEKEMERNRERYLLLKWASQAFEKFRVLPPSAGICHQVNLEYISQCVTTRDTKDGCVAFPDTLVGTDSHTTMVDALGIVGFGVGGIEAEAALLDQPVSFTTPKVLGVHLTGKMRDGVTATDFALTLTRLLRERGVVNMFVEFFGEGLKNLSLPDRATLSNMCPEYGATIAIFPVDEETLRYMRSTGRSDEQIELVRKYYEAQNMLNINYDKVEYSDVIEVDLDSIAPSVSGPSQPKQQLPLGKVKVNFAETFMEDDRHGSEHKIEQVDYTRWAAESETVENGKIKSAPMHKKLKGVNIKYEDGYETRLSDGDIVISSITSCTNTSNPSVMIGAGLLAKKALERGLSVNTRKVKTSLGPGSRVVTRYLERAGLMEPLAKLGYGLVGFGCITCIGNSGPLIDRQSDAINKNGLAVAAVLSGNRNYEARIHPDVRANYLMSPPLLIAYAIAGTVLKDLTKDPLGKNSKGEDIYLRDIWPSQKEINDVIHRAISIDMFEKEYGKHIYDVNPYWNTLDIPQGKAYRWDAASTYIRLPPFFEGFDPGKERSVGDIEGASVLAVFGDSISTDHISPAGAIGKDSPAGRYLIERGVKLEDFNTYGTRRGNHEVMMRGTFANNRIKNLMLPGVEGGYTLHLPDGKKTTIYEAAMQYKKENVPLVVIAGVEYGSGSSRDWAAKGPMLIGVKAVIAKSFERIHRSNLVGMGLLPLQFKSGQDAKTLNIDPTKPVSVRLPKKLAPKQAVKLIYTKNGDGAQSEAELVVRIDTPIEMEYYMSGGVLNHVIKKIMARHAATKGTQ